MVCPLLQASCNSLPARHVLQTCMKVPAYYSEAGVEAGVEMTTPNPFIASHCNQTQPS